MQPYSDLCEFEGTYRTDSFRNTKLSAVNLPRHANWLAYGRLKAVDHRLKQSKFKNKNLFPWLITSSSNPGSNLIEYKQIFKKI